MFKKIKLFFRSTWLCKVLTRLITGLKYVEVVCDFVLANQKETTSKFAKTQGVAEVTVTLIATRKLVVSALKALKVIAGSVCNTEEIEAKVDAMNIATVSDQLNVIADELDSLT